MIGLDQDPRLFVCVFWSAVAHSLARSCCDVAVEADAEEPFRVTQEGSVGEG